MPPSDTTINIHEAKTHLSRLIERVCAGETVVIAKAGKPLVRMVAVDAPPAPKRFGFMALQAAIPDDFDQMGQAEIEQMFYGKP